MTFFFATRIYINSYRQDEDLAVLCLLYVYRNNFTGFIIAVCNIKPGMAASKIPLIKEPVKIFTADLLQCKPQLTGARIAEFVGVKIKM